MNNSIKKRGFNKNKQHAFKKRAKTRKIISHPLSHLFTAEHYEETEQLIITFYECYLSNRFYYPRIEWSVPKNLLRFYTDSSKKEIKCVRISLENCDKEKQIIDPKEAQLFIKNCKHFMHEISTKQDDIKHASFRKFLSDKNKMILFLGEHHIYDQKRAQKYVAFLMKFFDSFKTIPGMIIDFFFETEPNKKDINFQKDRFESLYTPLYEKLKDSPHVRLHQTDYRGISTLEPLRTFAFYIIKRHEIEPFEIDISYVYSFLEIIKPMFDVNLFKINFPELLKQYQKINKVQFLRTLFLEFFEKPFREVNWLIDEINNYWMAKKQKYEQVKYYQQILNNRIISNPSYVISVWSRFMDIYTIGRILKPGYNYCVLHGGAYHTVDIQKTLEKHGLISSSDPSFPESISKTALDDYNEVEKNIDL